MGTPENLTNPSPMPEDFDPVVSRTSWAFNRFKDIESNVSVREQFTRDDYEYFRSSESVPNNKKKIILGARKAYEKIGLIRNIIDLMGDFTCQGIRIVHSKPSEEKFYRAWFKKVGGKDRSERFANLLYREANVVVKRDTAKIKVSDINELKRTMASPDLEVLPITNVKKREIPWRYTFFSPAQVDVVGEQLGYFLNELVYQIKLPTRLMNSIKNPKNDVEKALVAKLPAYIKDALNNKGNIVLDPEKTRAFFYKKDDWECWATPMIYPIMDDLILLEKLKLADLTALDGAISHIRIWKLGSLQTTPPILPNPNAIQKLKNILLHHTGGGSMDLVWGPELELQETSTDISKYLGKEKYAPTMMNIFQGLGIPPSLTGQSEGGFTNNFLALKTLVERLNYGRSVLTEFWEGEIRLVQKAMGFTEPAQIMYDHMVLSDESAFYSLLINLVDRNIISEDALRDRFGEISNIEKSRIKRQERDRENSKLPMKASPFHNPNVVEELRKIALQRGYTPSEIGLELDEFNEDEVLETRTNDPPSGVKGVPGRPMNSKDGGIRKKRTPKPRSTEAEEVMRKMLWASRAYDLISELILPSTLAAFKVKNIRSMTHEQFEDFENAKLAILCNVEPFAEITPTVIMHTMAQQPSVPTHVKTVYNSLLEDDFSIEQKRRAQILAYSV